MCEPAVRDREAGKMVQELDYRVLRRNFGRIPLLWCRGTGTIGDKAVP